MGQRILLFESDSDFAGQLQDGFGELGVELDVTADGNAGLEQAAAERPDVILLSVELPSINGFLLCKKIKKDVRLKDIPLVLLSTDAKADEIFEQHKKLRTRAEDYIQKPIDFGDLVARLQPWIKLPARARGGEALGEGPASRAGREVDAEIDAFADRAFDALVVEEGESTTVADASLVRDVLGRVESTGVRRSDPPPELRKSAADVLADLDVEVFDEPVSAPVARPSSRATAPSVDATEHRTSAPNDDGEHISGEHALGLGIANAELEAARAKITELEEEMARLRVRTDRMDRLERDLLEAQAKAAKGGGVSSREFLDLREALNRKDKDLLDLKDQLSSRDKQLLEMREKNLQLERAKTDVQDAVLATERKLADADDQISSLAADKQSAAKRADDLRARLERTEAKAKKLEGDLETERRNHATETQRLQKKAADELGAANRAHEEAAARLSGDHAAAVEDLRAAHASALAEAQEAHDAERASLIAKHETALENAAEAHASAVAALKKDHSDAANAAAEAHVQELREAHEAAEQAKMQALDELRTELTSEMDGKLAEARETHLGEMERAKREHEGVLDRTRTELEGAHALSVGELTQEHSRELAVLSRKLTEAERGLEESRANLDRTESERSRLAVELDVRTEERDTARDELDTQNRRVTKLEETETSQGARIQALESHAAELETGLRRATSKIDSDAQLLERAHKAAAIALGLLESQRSNQPD